jgi:hypothetical protein
MNSAAQMAMMLDVLVTTTVHQNVAVQEQLSDAAMQNLPKYQKAFHQKLQNCIWMSMKSLQ